MRRPPIPRRRFGVSFILGLLALIVTIAPASAGVGWCRADPIVTLDGAPLQIWVAIPEPYQPYVNGPIEVRIAVPKDVTEKLVVYTDAGFNGHGEEVIWKTLKKGSSSPDGVIPVRVEVKVKFSKKALKAAFGKGVQVPVRVEVIQNGASQWFEGTHTNTKFEIAVIGQAEQED
jgi:hypothetical protein